MVDGLDRVVIAPRYMLRLGDVRRWHVLEIICFRCGHVGAVDPSRLLRRWPGYTRLVDLEGKYHCSQCGNRAGNSWHTCQLPRNT